MYERSKIRFKTLVRISDGRKLNRRPRYKINMYKCINESLILKYTAESLCACVCVCVCVWARTHKDKLKLFRVLSSDGCSHHNEILHPVGMWESANGV